MRKAAYILVGLFLVLALCISACNTQSKAPIYECFCWDASNCSNLSLCNPEPKVNSEKPETCWDGSYPRPWEESNDANLVVCPSYTETMCSDGSWGLDIDLCPKQSKDIKFCWDGTPIEDASLCPTGRPAPPEE